MSYHVFDMLHTGPNQVNEFLITKGKEGLVAGVYLCRENGKMYVGSSVNLHARVNCSGTAIFP
jgi:hypothetical protein